MVINKERLTELIMDMEICVFNNGDIDLYAEKELLALLLNYAEKAAVREKYLKLG